MFVGNRPAALDRGKVPLPQFAVSRPLPSDTIGYFNFYFTISILLGHLIAATAFAAFPSDKTSN